MTKNKTTADALNIIRAAKTEWMISRATGNPDVEHEKAQALVKALALLDSVQAGEDFQWCDASEWHEDYGDCLFAMFIGQELQGIEWTSPITIDGPLEQWSYDKAIFKRVSMKTIDVKRLLNSGVIVRGEK